MKWKVIYTLELSSSIDAETEQQALENAPSLDELLENMGPITYSVEAVKEDNVD